MFGNLRAEMIRTSLGEAIRLLSKSRGGPSDDISRWRGRILSFWLLSFFRNNRLSMQNFLNIQYLKKTHITWLKTPISLFISVIWGFGYIVWSFNIKNSITNPAQKSPYNAESKCMLAGSRQAFLELNSLANVTSLLSIPLPLFSV